MAASELPSSGNVPRGHGQVQGPAGAATGMPTPGIDSDLHLIWPEEEDGNGWNEEEDQVIGREEEEEPAAGEEDRGSRYVHAHALICVDGKCA